MTLKPPINFSFSGLLKYLKKSPWLGLIFLIIVAVFYLLSPKQPLIKKTAACLDVPVLADNNIKAITKVIDGDTFLIEGGYSVRVLGIDADERGYPCYQAASKRLEELVLNKEAVLKMGKDNLDQYCRYLRYVFIGGENISLTLTKEGLAVARAGGGLYEIEIAKAEKEAMNDKIGCKWGNESVAVQGAENKVFVWNNLTEEKTGLKIVAVCEAKEFIGQEIIIEGKIAAAYRSKTDTVFLNFSQPYPSHCFTSVIFSSNQSQFPNKPENEYDGKTVRIKGLVKDYQGKPEIILETPEQIEIGK